MNSDPRQRSVLVELTKRYRKTSALLYCGLKRALNKLYNSKSPGLALKHKRVSIPNFETVTCLHSIVRGNGREVVYSECANYENVTLIFLVEPIMHPPEGAPWNIPKLAPFWDPVAQLTSS